MSSRIASDEYFRRVILGWGQTSDRSNEVRPCNCIGPQNGQPVCPCRMRFISIQNGRYVQIIDHGPAPADTTHTED